MLDGNECRAIICFRGETLVGSNCVPDPVYESVSDISQKEFMQVFEAVELKVDFTKTARDVAAEQEAVFSLVEALKVTTESNDNDMEQTGSLEILKAAVAQVPIVETNTAAANDGFNTSSSTTTSSTKPVNQNLKAVEKEQEREEEVYHVLDIKLSQPQLVTLLPSITKRQMTARLVPGDQESQALIQLCNLNSNLVKRNKDILLGCLTGVVVYCKKMGSLQSCHSWYDRVFSPSRYSEVGQYCPRWRAGPISVQCNRAVQALCPSYGKSPQCQFAQFAQTGLFPNRDLAPW